APNAPFHFFRYLRNRSSAVSEPHNLREPLPPIELFVMGVAKAFNDAITPGFTDREKDRGNPATEAQPDDWAKGDS
ncbi:MAG: hypothetical protein JXB23_07035, partial [Candidatus Aminicenantes bacterium]|nr:hypothetical protein [Candidatus Aminicenantes bacterium]